MNPKFSQFIKISIINFVIILILISIIYSEIIFSDAATPEKPRGGNLLPDSNYVIIGSNSKRHPYPYIASCVSFTILISLLALVICYGANLG